MLSSTIDKHRIERGIAVVEALHQRFNDLINGRHAHVEPCGPYDDGYTTWYCYCLTPALQEIGRPGWVDRHF